MFVYAIAYASNEMVLKLGWCSMTCQVLYVGSEVGRQRFESWVKSQKHVDALLARAVTQKYFHIYSAFAPQCGVESIRMIARKNENHATSGIRDSVDGVQQS